MDDRISDELNELLTEFNKEHDNVLVGKVFDDLHERIWDYVLDKMDEVAWEG